MSDKKKKSKKRAILTPTFRVSFPDIVTRNEMSNNYRIVMMFEKNADLTEIKKAAKEVRVAKWPNKLPKGFQNPFKLVDNMDEDDRYDGMEAGMIIISAKSAHRPPVVDKNRNPIDVEELDNYLYGGCYARAAITPYAYDKAGNRGVAFGLDALQIVKDGEPLGSRVNAQDVFANVEDEDIENDDEENDEFDL